MRGYREFYLDLAGNPALAYELMDYVVDLKIRYWEEVLENVGDMIDVVVLEDDLGQQDRLLVSPSMYREVVKPRHKRIFSFLRSKLRDQTYLMLHSDGAILELIPDLIEMGVQILNPIQSSAAGMNLEALKKEFGKDLVFWGGGIESQGVLSFGTPDEVRNAVARNIEILAPGGGFVFSVVHNIQPEVPPENILAMWEALQEYGIYT